jgi:DNA-binding beta-propeller fold protein YncE
MKTECGGRVPLERRVICQLFICVLLLLISCQAWALQPYTELYSGLKAGVGLALDETSNHLYYLEYNAASSNLKQMTLSPDCENDPSTACTVSSIPADFSHPEDVQLDLEHGVAYVTTRDSPGTGGLWRLDLTSGAKTLITFNLGAPQQLFLDAEHQTAYTVGYDDGRLRRIDLNTGVKTPLFVGLSHPVGIVLTADRRFAYVSEQDAPARISKIDLTLGVKVQEMTSGMVAPFFLAWTDSSQSALYVVQRDPVNRVVRLDLATADPDKVAINLPFRPSGITVRDSGQTLFVTTDKNIVKIDLYNLTPTEPVFTQVGHVPATEIDANGYADTMGSGYFYRVRHAPFGGTINIFGNLSNFKAQGASHYRLLVAKDGGTYEALSHSWRAYKWNPVMAKYEPVTIAPETGTTYYPIPDEYPLQAARWVPPFLMMRWPSGANGDYDFKVEIYNKISGPPVSWDPLTHKLPSAANNLVLKVDNTPPQVNIARICQQVTTAVPVSDPCHPRREVQACDIVSAPNNNYRFVITAYDPNHHLRHYGLTALWGRNNSDRFIYEHYASHIDEDGPYQWSGVVNESVPIGGWEADCDCAYTFSLWAAKRTINGYNYIHWRRYHQSITINNTGAGCP